MHAFLSSHLATRVRTGLAYLQFLCHCVDNYAEEGDARCWSFGLWVASGIYNFEHVMWSSSTAQEDSSIPGHQDCEVVQVVVDIR